jgi:hypothetical protein
MSSTDAPSFGTWIVIVLTGDARSRLTPQAQRHAGAARTVPVSGKMVVGRSTDRDAEVCSLQRIVRPGHRESIIVL